MDLFVFASRQSNDCADHHNYCGDLHIGDFADREFEGGTLFCLDHSRTISTLAVV
jgi:hypothetical protein